MKIYGDDATSTLTTRPMLKRLSTGHQSRSDGPAQAAEASTAPSKTSQPRSLRSRLTWPKRLNPGTWHSRSIQVPVWALELALALALIFPIAIMIIQPGARNRSSDPAPASMQQHVVGESIVISGLPESDEPGRSRMSSPFVAEYSVTRTEPIVESARQSYLRDEGIDPEGSPSTQAEEELLRLRAELEEIQRNAAVLRSLARQQSGDLSVAYSSLEATQEQSEGALQDLDSRIRELEQRIIIVDELARDLRRVLGLPESPAIGGPLVPGTQGEDVDPWLALRADIVVIERQAEALVYSLEEVNTEIQIRLLSVQRAGLPRSGGAYDDLAFYDQMPVGWPIQGPITSRFGGRENPFGAGHEFHTGIDIAAPTGTPVYATGAGTVRISGSNGGYGLLVVIDHGRGVSTWYGHNSRLLVSPGQTVSAGQVIAEVGSTGYSTGPHVHYEVRINNVPTDPLPLMQMTR